MRRPDVCNRSPTRAPSELYDSRSSRVSGPLARALLRGRSGRASLDGDPPASGGRRAAPPRPPGGEATATTGRCSVLAGAAIDSPSGSAPRRRLRSATGRGCDPTSGTLGHGCAPRPPGTSPGERHPPGRARPGGTQPLDPFPYAAASTSAFSTDQGAFRRRVLPRRGSPPPYARLCRRGPASDAPSPLLPKRLDPIRHSPPEDEEGGPGQRRSSTSATVLSTREHDRSIA